MADENQNGANSQNQQTAGDPGNAVQDTSKTAPVQDGAAGAAPPNDPFAALQDADTREWIAKRGLKTPEDVFKTAYEQAKLLGNAIRVPAKDATPEEREAFLNKLGRPEKPDGYEFKAPADLPKELPYDGERAKAFAELAHKAGLTREQGAMIHDWAVKNALADFKGMTEGGVTKAAEEAKSATEALTKEWGPLSGDTARANLAFADTALRELPGGAELMAELEAKGFVATLEDGTKLVRSAPITKFLASVGGALFKEGEITRGNPAFASNPFAAATKNETLAGQMVKNNPEQARTMIVAAGLKPEQFGLK